MQRWKVLSHLGRRTVANFENSINDFDDWLPFRGDVAVQIVKTCTKELMRMRRKMLFPYSPRKTTTKAGHLALWPSTVFPIHCLDL